MEHFIETVKKFPCLWNTNAIEYRDQELKEAAWGEVMRETNLGSVKEVKNKWKKLRDSYRDALKRQSDLMARDPVNAAKRPYPWKYMGLMQFLQPHMSARPKKVMTYSESQVYQPPMENGVIQNGVESHTTEESESEPEMSPARSRKRKNSEQLTVIDRKLDYLCKSQTKKQFTDASFYQQEIKGDVTGTATVPDPLDIFFNSMCQSTKRLPFTNQIKIKKILFNAVIEAEEQITAEQQNYANMWVNNGAASSSSSNQDEEESEQKDQSFMQTA